MPRVRKKRTFSSAFPTEETRYPTLSPRAVQILTRTSLKVVFPEFIRPTT